MQSQVRKRYFRRWDWEYDQGVEELSDQCLPPDFVAVYVDAWNRIYRVSAFEHGEHVYSYDYYFDDVGRLIEKRGIDPYVDGQVCIIVRFYYDDQDNTITESAWWPDSNDPPKSITRKRNEDCSK